MRLLTDDKIRLRALELSDLDVYYAWNNDSENWESSGVTVPASKQSIIDYILNNKQDFFDDRQAKFGIELIASQKLIGYADIYNYDHLNNRAEIGLFIADGHRNQNIGTQVVDMLTVYADKHLHIHQLFAQCLERNIASIGLFKKCGFEQCALLKEWSRGENGYENVIEMQKIFNK